MKTTIIGIPLDLGSTNLGVDIAPDAFRHQQIVAKLEKSGFKITDNGNIDITPRKQLRIGNKNLKYLDEIVRVSKKTAALTDQLIRKKEKIIALGGDHSISLGLVSGASVCLEGNLGLIYLDAHGDMNTDKTTLTGNIHGMHLASLIGFGHPLLKNLYGKNIKIKKENLLHVGGIDLDEAEEELIQKNNLKCFKVFDLLANGLNPLLQMIKDLQSQVKNIWVSLDLDVIDYVYAPGTGIPNKAGLSYREIVTIAEYIGKQCNVVGIDVVEYNPLRDIEGKTSELAIELMAKLYGLKYSWYTEYLEQNR